jgi:hypothetical protein
VVGEHVVLERNPLGREAFEADAELFGAFGTTLPEIVGDDRAVDLGADGQAEGDGIGSEAFGIRAVGDGGPSDPHGRSPGVEDSAFVAESERGARFVERVIGEEFFEAAF